ncbi:MAG: YfhO family protein, partial [Clostridia bacterium]|nr:YfhO family protein [Clostridia bacterium]
GQIETKTAYLLCCAVTLPSVLILLFDIKKYGKRGIYLLLCAALTLLPIIIEPLNVLWHLGSYAGFPLRLGFITCFMPLFISAAVFNEMGSHSSGAVKADYNYKKLLYLIFCILSVCAFYYLYSLSLKNYKDDIIYSGYLLEILPDAFAKLAILFLILAAVYFVIMLGIRLKLLKINVAAALLALIVITEALTNFEMFVASKKTDNTEFAGRLELSQTLKEIDSGNYRVKDFALFDKHNTSIISGNSFNHYTSLTNKYAAASLERLGYTKAWLWISNVSGTVFSDSLLSHKYVINKGEITNSYLEYVGESSEYDIYRNPYSLDMGIITQSGAFESEQRAPLKYQDELFKHITASNLFTFYDYETLGINIDTANGITYFNAKNSSPVIYYDIFVSEKQVLYFDIDTIYSNSINVKVNGASVISNYPNNDCNGIIELGVFENENVYVELKLESDITANSIELGGLLLNKMNELKQYALSADSANFGGGKYVITADNVSGGSSLILSVPYDEGFTCYVNGNKKDIKLTCEGFMLVELDEGDNIAEFVYYPKGLSGGIAAFAVGILLIAFIIFLKGGFKFKPSKKMSAVTENICYYAFIAITIASFAVMIVFPVAAFFVKVFI